MLSRNTIKEFAVKWQTSELNVKREYVQHVFLSYLYQFPKSEKLAFKGGTALRLLYRSPRFSEDLDFTGQLRAYHLRNLLEQTLKKSAQEGVHLNAEESKPTSGRYLALYSTEVYRDRVQIELNISLRERAMAEPLLVTSPLFPSYQCMSLPVNALVNEKCQALLSRRKPRDFYDLLFLLRDRLGIEAILPLKPRLLKTVHTLDSKQAARELKLFLPVSHHRVISNLRQVLVNELTRL